MSAGASKDIKPAGGAVAITTDNSNDLARIPTRALYTGAGGDIKVRMAEGNDVTFVGTPAGAVLPVQVVRIFATGTAATSIVALY